MALGSNLGPREEYLDRARQRLEEEGIFLLRASAVVETEPWGITDQPRFLNQVLLVDVHLDPHPLLEVLKAIERQLGRTPGPRWGPREIDIDILFYGEQVIDTPELRIPHPGLPERPFWVEVWNAG